MDVTSSWDAKFISSASSTSHVLIGNSKCFLQQGNHFNEILYPHKMVYLNLNYYFFEDPNS